LKKRKKEKWHNPQKKPVPTGASGAMTSEKKKKKKMSLSRKTKRRERKGPKRSRRGKSDKGGGGESHSARVSGVRTRMEDSTSQANKDWKRPKKGTANKGKRDKKRLNHRSGEVPGGKEKKVKGAGHKDATGLP